METSALAQQVESVERSVAFLQQEHLVLLTGLRLEILHLRKRCAELSCELSERLPMRTQADVDEEQEQLEARLQTTEQRLAERECGLADLRLELRRKGVLAGALQARLRDEERRFLDELKRRSHKITALGRQLRQQTDVAAQLSFQLHSARFRLYHEKDGGGEEEEEGEEEEDEVEESEEGSPESDWSLSAQASPEVVERRPPRVYMSSRSRRSERVRECVPRMRVYGPEEPRPMPDPALFLYPFRHRLLPLHASLGRICRENDQSETSEERRGRHSNQSPVRGRMEPDTTEL
ncbi:coiled-coil domain-containing protein 92 [Clupea harengus]|uniref:Coiled-coil domain-containing protein 92 n=1 Tax=Clupea harengus TaxID=7950 RepID=A0A6P8FHG8_CLUHA|nr:coiled-coil domain-containing protein 92 [Clupea harengus]